MMTEKDWIAKRLTATPKEWVLLGCPVPPPEWYKQWYIRHCIGKYGIQNFVETGTYLAETTLAILPWVELVYTFELDRHLWNRAVGLLSRFPHVIPLYGDSGDGLQRCIPFLSGKTLFWLDAHYSGPGTSGEEGVTAINKEVEVIIELAKESHVVLVDDIRGFGKCKGYPTVDELVKKYKRAFPASIGSVSNDILTLVTNL